MTFNKKHTALAILLTLSLAAVIGFISGTFAFFNQDEAAENFLYVKNLKVDLIDDFNGNVPILPGDTRNKDVYMKNNGEVDSVIRIKLTPSWIPPTDTLSQPLLTSAVTVTLGQNDGLTGWVIKDDGWYYYNKILKPGESSTKLVDNLKLAAVSNDPHAVDYSSAAYSLDVESQSLQAFSLAAVESWSMAFTIDNTGHLIWTTP